MSVHDVASAGTSIWLDDLSRAKITGTDPHSLPSRIANSGVVGVTTNPSIFSSAISGAAEYSADIAAMKGATVDDVVKKLTTDDVRQACDLFSPIFSFKILSIFFIPGEEDEDSIIKIFFFRVPVLFLLVFLVFVFLIFVSCDEGDFFCVIELLFFRFLFLLPLGLGII